MQCSAVQCSAVQCSAVQCSAVQCTWVPCSAVQCRAVQCSAVQCSAVQCSAVQCSAVRCSPARRPPLPCSLLQRLRTAAAEKGWEQSEAGTGQGPLDRTGLHWTALDQSSSLDLLSIWHCDQQSEGPLWPASRWGEEGLIPALLYRAAAQCGGRERVPPLLVTRPPAGRLLVQGERVATNHRQPKNWLNPFSSAQAPS